MGCKRPRTREDWERGWKRIESIFGDLAPHTVTLEHVDGWYHALKRTVGVREAHRAVKIWRALWQVAAAMRYCDADRDPTFGIRRETPKARSATWQEGEIVRLVKGSWRAGYRGLACIQAIAWDTGFSPVDVRTLTLAQSRTDGRTIWFVVDRTKTGQPAIGTLSRRTEALVRAYSLHSRSTSYRALRSSARAAMRLDRRGTAAAGRALHKGHAGRGLRGCPDAVFSELRRSAA